MAEFAINQIGAERRKEQRKTQKCDGHVSRRLCYVIDSIKHPAELEILRKVYGDILYCVGVSATVGYRIDSIRNRNMKMGKKEGGKTNQCLSKHEAEKLMDLDSGEGMDYGQGVRETFHQADFFLKVDSSQDCQIDTQIDRFLSAVFADKILTPTSHEQAMHVASSAANNSACMARQVGAAITDVEGNVLGIGWNDVPKFGGNLYTEASKSDHRCMALHGGICQNDYRKGILADEIVDKLAKSKLIALSKASKAKATSIIMGSKIKDLLEFSRSVHAEMHAIINASRSSASRMIGGRLYCTTYPCHSCARHIIAAGISEVFYLEPYRKSLAIELHGDAMTENEAVNNNKVRLLAFEGVAPRRFNDFFKAKPDSRKKDSKLSLNRAKDAEPMSKVSLNAIPQLEWLVTTDLRQQKLIKR